MRDHTDDMTRISNLEEYMEYFGRPFPETRLGRAPATVWARKAGAARRRAKA